MTFKKRLGGGGGGGEARRANRPSRGWRPCGFRSSRGLTGCWASSDSASPVLDMARRRGMGNCGAGAEWLSSGKLSANNI